MSTQPSVTDSAYRPSLDGVRTVAVYLVVLFHSGLAAASGGFVGVDVFFVLSGFLIANLLLADIDRFGRVRLAHFYSRRVRRLLPAALVAITVTSVAFLLLAGVVERLPFVGDAQSALLYVANWRFLREQNDYFASGVTRSPFLHFWSLAIEEQFYVVFPILLVLLSRVGRRRSWVPIATVAALLCASLGAQFYWAARDANHAYYGTDTRAYQLLAGVLLALMLRRASQRRHGASSAAATAGLIGVVLLGTGLLPVGVSERGVLVVGAATLLIGGLAGTERGAVHRALSQPAMAYLGRVSYGTYLWHWPVILVLAHLISLPPLLVAGVTIPTATAIAAASHRWVEMPIRRARIAPARQWATVASGATACALIAALGVPPVLGSNQRPAISPAADNAGPTLPPSLRPVADARRSAVHHRARVPSGIKWGALATDFGPERTCGASNPQECVVVAGGAPHVLLVGDSHGRMLAPSLISLAREYHFTLSLNVLPSCPWQAQLSNLSLPESQQARCTAARDVWYRTVLPQLHPDVVVLASYARDDPAVYGQTLKRTGGSNETLYQVIRNTTAETLARITATGARALILDDIITTNFDPLNCLSRARFIDQCHVPTPRAERFSDTVYKAAAHHSPTVFTFDINRIVCPAAPLCDAMIDGINVWRNDNHYSTRILVHLREQIWRAMTGSGAFGRR